MANFYRQLQELLDQGLDVAVATITATKGSTPRGVGTKMIIHPYGRHVGTVGGGCGEADVIRAGLDVLADGQPRTVVVDLTEEISMQSLGVCGGILHVFIERWRGLDAPAGRPADAPADIPAGIPPGGADAHAPPSGQP